MLRGSNTAYNKSILAKFKLFRILSYVNTKYPLAERIRTMNPIIAHVFKCGCRSDSYYSKNVNRAGIICTVRFCPKCSDSALSDRAAKNKACSLAYMEGHCKKCGEVTTISKNTTTNIRLILCPGHKHLRNLMNRQLRNVLTKKSHKYPREQKEFAICPCCEKQHAVTATSFSTKTPRIFCTSCERQRNAIDYNFL